MFPSKGCNKVGAMHGIMPHAVNTGNDATASVVPISANRPHRQVNIQQVAALVNGHVGLTPNDATGTVAADKESAAAPNENDAALLAAKGLHELQFRCEDARDPKNVNEGTATGEDASATALRHLSQSKAGKVSSKATKEKLSKPVKCIALKGHGGLPVFTDGLMCGELKNITIAHSEKWFEYYWILDPDRKDVWETKVKGDDYHYNLFTERIESLREDIGVESKKIMKDKIVANFR